MKKLKKNLDAIIIVQARATSGRFPNKVMQRIKNKTLLEILIHRLKQSKECKKIVIAIPKNSKQKKLYNHLKKLNVSVFQGDESNVLDRYYKASLENRSDFIVRVTGDCPLMDAKIIDRLLKIAKEKDYDYVSNVYPPSFPNGLDVSVIRSETLYDAWKNSKSKFDKEHVVPFIQKSRKFKKFNLTHNVDLSSERWTVDEPEDFQVIKEIISHFRNLDFDWKSILKLKSTNPKIFYHNRHITRDEGSNKQISVDRKSWRKVNNSPPGRILIFGSSGFLGKKIVKSFKKKNYKVFTDLNYKKRLRKDSNYNFILKILNKVKPNIVINLIALTDVDKCEKNKEIAKKSNILFPLNLAKAIKKTLQNIYVIHMSTDQVYNGKGGHLEKFINPINYYGTSKFEGEKYFKDLPSLILRTNFIGKSDKNQKKTLSDWILYNLRNKKKINTFKNIYFSPLHTSTLIKIIDKLMIRKIEGVYNLGSKNKISKAKFASLLGSILNCDLDLLNEIKYNNKYLVARRPLDMSLNINNFEKNTRIKLPYVLDEIEKLAKEYK